MPQFSNTVISLFHNVRVKREAPDQGGLLTGVDPASFNVSDPLRLWIIQLGVIVMTSQLLGLGLRKMKQPKVIAEVLGGILLGPTAFGRIPGFTDHIFPTDSQPYLSLTANIGLCLFLFLVGLEIDSAVIKRNARLSATVALSGMILPFGFGAALSVPLYHQFIPQDIKFTYFMLFTGVAYSITAFPVLCRILTELKLLDTTVGIVVLSAGVGNDIIGWTLLALSVALVNAGSGLTALYILLTCFAWTLVLLFPVKMALRWLARKTGSTENGPTMFFMTVTILLLFASAFFTDIIGVHAIFGAFVAGIIVPREGGLTIALTEKLEDMVSIIFLPLYFTLSGLSTDLGLLDNGITWAYTIAIIALAFIGKFGGCSLAAHYIAKFNWRESCTIGSLMSCKGLVELIVLNVGLSAGILTPKVFSMFVLEALTLTFVTTPLVTAFYPPNKRVRVAATGANFNNVAGDEAGGADRFSRDDAEKKTRFTIILDKIDHLPGMMAFTQLIKPSSPSSPSTVSRISTDVSSSRKGKQSELFIDAVRLIELSDRVSAVMKSSVSDTLLRTDSLLAIFRMFGQLNNIPITTSLSIVQYDDLSYRAAEHARDNASDLLVIPWLSPTAVALDGHGNDGAMTPRAAAISNPFDVLFKSTGTEKSTSALQSHFVRGVFSQSKVDVALYVDPCESSGQTGSYHHIYLPFFGGPDDRLALDFVMQLCDNPKTSATIVRVVKKDFDADLVEMDTAHLGDEKMAEEINKLTIPSAGATAATFPDTVYGHATTETRLQSVTADSVAWARCAPQNDVSSTSSSVNSRVEFKEIASPIPLHAVIQEAASKVDPLHRTRVTVVTGRSRRLAVESHHQELKKLMEEYGSISPEISKTIGDVATALVLARSRCGIVVLQAANVSLD